MESICSFEPLWKEREAITRPNKAILDIRIRSMRIFLEKSRSGPKPTGSPSIEYVLSECIYIINALFYTWASSNAIIDRLLTMAVQGEHIPLHLIRGAIALWYTSSISVFTRDPQQGLPLDAEVEIDDDGTTILRWSREHAAELHDVGNLGLMAMLLTSEIWQTVELPKLQLAALVSNATTTLLFAAYMISARMRTINSWDYVLSVSPNDEAMKLFLRSSWQIAREGIHKAITPPGIDFGTTLDEVKLARNGRNVLSKIGRGTWSEAPYWHPGRKVPGSPWNKYIRNMYQPYFPLPGWSSTNLLFKLPSSALTLVAPWQNYYGRLRSKFDQTGRPRKTMEFDSRELQFLNFGAKTGHQYPMSNPAELTANFAEDIDQEYQYTVPMVKKPMTDLRGDLTLPFLTTAARAIRFEDEPDEVERGFFIMTFTHEREL